MMMIYAQSGGDAEWPFDVDGIGKLPAQEEYNLLPAFARLTGKLSNSTDARAGIKLIRDFGARFRSSNVGPGLANLPERVGKERQARNHKTAADDVEAAANVVR